MTANPARLLVRDQVKTAQPTWNVLAEARTPDAVIKPTAVVWTAQLARLDAGGGQFIQSTVELWLLPPSDLQPGPLEDKADAMLLEALNVVETTEGLTWSQATRGALDGAFHGWHLTLTVAHQLTKEA